MLSADQLKENHEICLELLDKFLDVCNKNNIEYYLAFGSCLGTVRHHGFIPWDINIDVLMTVDEYNKLDTAMQREDLGDMRWCKPGARLFSLLMKKNSWDYKTKPNIDISIYGKAPNNKFFKSVIIKFAYFNIKMYKLKNTHVKRCFPYNILKCFSLIIPNSFYKFVVSYLQTINKNKMTKSYFVLLPSVWGDKESINVEWFGEQPAYGTFEGRKVRILANYHDYLRQRYGDYMTPVVWKDKGEYKHAAKQKKCTDNCY